MLRSVHVFHLIVIVENVSCSYIDMIYSYPDALNYMKIRCKISLR